MKSDNNIRDIHVYTRCHLLWEQKNTLFIITVFCMMIGCIYLALAKPQWTSVMFISSPQLGQLSNYPEAVDLSWHAQTWADEDDLSTKVFNLFLANVDAYIERDKPNSPVSVFKAKTGHYHVLSFSSSNAKLAQAELTELVAFLNQQTQQSLYQSVHQALELRKLSLQRRLNALETNVKAQDPQSPVLWENGWQKIKNTPLKEGEINRLANHMTDAPLLAMETSTALNLLTHDSRLPLEVQIFDTKTTLSLLSSFKLNESRFHAVNVISPPSLAKHRDSPRILFVIGLSSLLGIAVGVAYVFIRHSWYWVGMNTATNTTVDQHRP